MLRHPARADIIAAESLAPLSDASATETQASGAHASSREPVWTMRGTAAYRRISIALFLAGFATFSLLYCVQPLLPTLALEYRVSPAESSLVLSLSTGFLAVSIMASALVSEAFGRRGLIFMSMCAAAALNMTDAIAPNWTLLLISRALEGLVLGGAPAVAMAYLAEEIDPKSLGFAMGLYVAGTAFGGMAGRVAIGLLTEITSWRMALGILGFIDLLAALGFLVLLPTSRNFVARPGINVRYHIDAWLTHLRAPGLRFLFLIGFAVMGAFVTIYNYASFRLSAAPYNLGETAISFIFIVYIFGIVASSLAGALADRLGRRPVLISGICLTIAGVALTLAQSLPAIVTGVAAVTFGFFVAHSVASGWVGRRAAGAKGHASSLYLLAYYVGSSAMGSLGGWFWSAGGWPAVTGFTSVLLVIALIAALRIGR
jgi:YNFM family putative membrane transporter